MEVFYGWIVLQRRKEEERELNINVRWSQQKKYTTYEFALIIVIWYSQDTDRQTVFTPRTVTISKPIKKSLVYHS